VPPPGPVLALLGPRERERGGARGSAGWFVCPSPRRAGPATALRVDRCLLALLSFSESEVAVGRHSLRLIRIPRTPRRCVGSSQVGSFSSPVT
jgi:hypothetical protein